MAKRKASEDVIQRSYLLRHHARERNRLLKDYPAEAAKDLSHVRGRIHQIELEVAWIKKQAQRASKPGGIGRK